MRVVYGQKLRERRKFIGQSVMDTAYMAGLNASYVYRLEGGEHRAKDGTAEALAKALLCTVEEFSDAVEREKADAVKLAEREGFSRIRAYQYLSEGRVSGAYKAGDNWVIPDVENARILPYREEVHSIGA